MYNFSDAGPTEETLRKSSFKAVFIGRGWTLAPPDTLPETTFDREVRTSVSGPEPGYLATSKMFSAMARHVLEHDLKSPEELVEFRGLGYAHNPEKSAPRLLIFTRPSRP